MTATAPPHPDEPDTAAPEGGGALVSVATQILDEPGVRATVKAVARESDFSEDELTEIVVEGWERGLRPLRSIALNVRWDVIVRASNKHAGYEVRNPDPLSVDRKAFKLMTPDAMLRTKAIPLGFTEDGKVQVSIYDPTDTGATDEVQATLRNYEVQWYVADGDAITATVSAIVSRDSIDLTDSEEEVEEDGGLLAVDDPAEGPIVKLVENIIQQAIALNASDIHLEPAEDGLVLKYRRDGVLIERDRYPRDKGQGIINRFKTACEMPLDKIRPLDGRMELRLRGKRYDLRVATCPTVWEMESVVIRLLATQQSLLDLTQLFPEAFLDQYLPVIGQPDGLILVVGRTGDGKSTTLAATLNTIARPTVKTCTVEDPVEYKIPGVLQVEVNQKAGRDFPKVLKSFLRSDPDIIMVGEIRDQETGDIAVKAAQTGHLVLSTLHIRDVCGTPSRLMNMGIEPIMIADTLTGVLSQRLIRRLCTECKTSVDYDKDTLLRNGWDPEMPADGSQFFSSSKGGCTNCAGTGFNGRVAVPELMVVHDDVRDMIAKGEPASQIRERCTTKHSMRSMRQSALTYLAAGVTTLDEINRVIQ